MKFRLTFLLFLLISHRSFSQKSAPIPNEDGNIIIYRVSAPTSKIPLILETNRKLTSRPVYEFLPGDNLGTFVYLEDSNEIRLSAAIKKDSLKYYRYSILENDTNLLADHKIPDKIYENGQNSWRGYQDMDLGITAVSNNKITIKIYRLPDSNEVTTVVLYNKPLKPATVWRYEILTATGLNNAQIQSRDMRYAAGIHVNEKTRGLRIAFQKTDIDFLHRMHIVRTSADGSHIDFASLQPAWKYDQAGGNPSFTIDASNFSKPGEYKIFIMPQLGTETNVSEIYRENPQFVFKVLSVAKTYQAKEIAGIVLIILLSGGLIAGLIAFSMKKRNRYKLRAIQKKADLTKAELDQIRSRLNPHFVYNSLSGIQNLMNRNEVEKANAYLSKFARLTRNILEEKERISLQEEYKLLDDYLSMERLRFQFSYEIKTGGPPDLLQVEIPAMLLQPFAENASKHSMSAMREKGELLITFASEGKNLVLTIKDNGPGFDPDKAYKGLGLQLCKKRMDLLNKVYIECPISLNIISGISGTTVVITLNNWL